MTHVSKARQKIIFLSCFVLLASLMQKLLPANGQTATNAVAGRAVQLSGSDYVRATWVGDAFYDFTFELWFKASTGGVLIGEVDSGDASAWDYALAEISNGGTIRAGVPGVTPINVGVVALGTWHHLALVYNDSQKKFSAYLDGSLAGSSEGARSMPNAWHYTYCIGRGGPANLRGGGFFSGLIDEVRLWNRALSTDEIAFQYDKVINVNDLSLRYYWRFDSVVAGKSYLSPAVLETHEAGHVPQTAFQLVSSTAPVANDPRPIVTSVSAAPVASGAAELQGTVNPNGTETTVFFEFRQGDNATQRTETRNIGAGTNAVSFTQVVTGLGIGAGYNYRLVSSNAFGVIASIESSFTPSSWAGYAYETFFTVLPPGCYLRTTKNQTDFFPGKDMTIELWFRFGHEGALVAETDFNGNFDQNIIEVIKDEPREIWNVRVGLNGLGEISLGQVQPNIWSHVALRYNSDTQILDGFLNGVKAASTNGVRVTSKELGFQQQFLFGRAPFIGVLDEIRVWNVARTDEDLASARFNLLAGDESGLVLNWRGAPTGNDNVPDFSPRGNDGQNYDCSVISSTAPLVFNVRHSGEAHIETQFAIKSGTQYRLESSPDLQFWTAISTNVAPASGYVRIPEGTSSRKLEFYRVVAQ